MRKFLTIMFAFYLFLDLYVFIECSQNIKAFRLFQYEKNETQYGSQYSVLNYIGAYFKSDCLRKLALLNLNELQGIKELDLILKSNINALLLIIPEGPYNLNFRNLINEMQIYFSEKSIYLPVYFTFENEEIQSIYNKLKNEYTSTLSETSQNKETTKNSILDYLGLNKNYLYFSLKISEPKIHKSQKYENFYGFLEVSSRNNQPNPLIAIVTHYDSLGVISDLPQGLNSNGSGIIALLELIRILSKFYENYDGFIKYDILFVLTSSGNLNFEGTKKFVESLEPSINENLNFVLCIDSLANLENNNNLYMHISRFPKEHEMLTNKLYNIFNTTSKNLGINLEYVKKKIYLDDKYIPWEHELFSKKKILSATISTKIKEDNSIFNRTLMIDTSLNHERLIKNIKFLTESLLEFLFDYNIKKYSILKNEEFLIDEDNINGLIKYLKTVPRSPLALEKGSKFNNDLFNNFGLYLQKTKRQTYEFNEINFYDANSGIIKIFNVKSKMIDLFLLVAVIIYLFIIFVYIKGIKGTINEIKGIFKED